MGEAFLLLRESLVRMQEREVKSQKHERDAPQTVVTKLQDSAVIGPVAGPPAKAGRH